MSFTCKEPKLRFPEFSGEWVEKKLSQIIDFKSGYAFPSSNMSSEVQQYQLIKMSNVYQNILALDRSPSYWQKINKSESEFLLNQGDVILTLTGTVGKRDYGYSIMIQENNKFLLNQRLVRLRAIEEISISKFIRNLVLHERFLYNFFINSKGGTGNQSNVSIEDLKQIKLPLPSKPEQEKIASFLTAVDAKIEQLTCKEKLLEKYKKSAMQKLFSQELRFTRNDGRAYPEWEEKKLGEVAEIIMGQSPDSSSYNSDEIGTPLIQGNADIQNRLSNPRNWTTQVTKECEIGDLILTVRAPVGAIAKSIHHACIGRGVCAIRNNAKSNIEFLFQFLLNFESKWGSLEQGSTFTAVSGNEIKNLKIHLPSLPEQTKIANFLSAIDEKLLHVKTQIEQTKQFKKALLQQMFV